MKATVNYTGRNFLTPAEFQQRCVDHLNRLASINVWGIMDSHQIGVEPHANSRIAKTVLYMLMYVLKARPAEHTAYMAANKSGCNLPISFHVTDWAHLESLLGRIGSIDDIQVIEG